MIYEFTLVSWLPDSFCIRTADIWRFFFYVCFPEQEAISAAESPPEDHEPPEGLEITAEPPEDHSVTGRSFNIYDLLQLLRRYILNTALDCHSTGRSPNHRKIIRHQPRQTGNTKRSAGATKPPQIGSTRRSPQTGRNQTPPDRRKERTTGNLKPPERSLLQ